jgi:hypothetical protein
MYGDVHRVRLAAGIALVMSTTQTRMPALFLGTGRRSAAGGVNLGLPVGRTTPEALRWGRSSTVDSFLRAYPHGGDDAAGAWSLEPGAWSRSEQEPGVAREALCWGPRIRDRPVAERSSMVDGFSGPIRTAETARPEPGAWSLEPERAGAWRRARGSSLGAARPRPAPGREVLYAGQLSPGLSARRRRRDRSLEPGAWSLEPGAWSLEPERAGARRRAALRIERAPAYGGRPAGSKSAGAADGSKRRRGGRSGSRSRHRSQSWSGAGAGAGAGGGAGGRAGGGAEAGADDDADADGADATAQGPGAHVSILLLHGPAQNGGGRAAGAGALSSLAA